MSQTHSKLQIEACTETFRKAVVLKPKVFDFEVKVKTNSLFLSSNVVNVNELVSRRIPTAVPLHERLEIQAKSFTGKFIVEDFAFDVTVKRAPADILVQFFNISMQFLSKKQTLKVTKKRVRFFVDKLLVQNIPIDTIQVVSFSRGFKVNGLKLQACAKAEDEPLPKSSTMPKRTSLSNMLKPQLVFQPNTRKQKQPATQRTKRPKRTKKPRKTSLLTQRTKKPRKTSLLTQRTKKPKKTNLLKQRPTPIHIHPKRNQPENPTMPATTTTTTQTTKTTIRATETTTLTSTTKTTTIKETTLDLRTELRKKPWKRPKEDNEARNCCPEPLELSSTTESTITSEFVTLDFQEHNITTTMPSIQKIIYKVIFIIDSGLYEGKSNKELLTKVLVHIVSQLNKFTFSKDKNNARLKKMFQIGLVMFSKSTAMQFDSNHIVDATDLSGTISKLLSQIKSVPHEEVETNFIPALQNALSEVACSFIQADTIYNVVLFMTSSTHKGCHVPLKFVAEKVRSKVSISVIGIGNRINKDELNVIAGGGQVNIFTSLSQVMKIRFSKKFVLHKFINDKFCGNSGIVYPAVHVLCEFAPVGVHTLPSAIRKDNLQKMWKATVDLFDHVTNICGNSDHLEAFLKFEIGGNTELSKQSTRKLFQAIGHLSQQVLEGKFKMISTNVNKKLELKKWLGEEKGLGFLLKRLDLAYIQMINSSTENTVDDNKKGCLQEIFAISNMKMEIDVVKRKVKAMQNMKL